MRPFRHQCRMKQVYTHLRTFVGPAQCSNVIRRHVGRLNQRLNKSNKSNKGAHATSGPHNVRPLVHHAAISCASIAHALIDLPGYAISVPHISAARTPRSGLLARVQCPRPGLHPGPVMNDTCAGCRRLRSVRELTSSRDSNPDQVRSMLQ